MPDAQPRVLVVVTNHGEIDGRPTTGVWFTEFSEPYAALSGAGARVTVASPLGGPAPVDPRGYPSRREIADVRDALAVLNATVRLDQVDITDFDGIFFPGGDGPMFDLAADARTKQYIAAAWEAGRPVGAVCHGPAALLGVELSDGTTLLRGRRATGFTRGEDAEDALFAHMPFSLQDRMIAEGATFVEEPPTTVHVETDGLLVTGQNPASAEATARAFLAALTRASGSDRSGHDASDQGGGAAVPRFLVEATIDPAQLDLLAAKREDHYAFLVAHQSEIVFGGPTRTRDGGPPEKMVIVVEAASLADAQGFIDREPYHRNGGFSAVTVRPWSQVLPEPEPGLLQHTVDTELGGR